MSEAAAVAPDAGAEPPESPRGLRRLVDKLQRIDSYVAGGEAVVTVLASLAMVLLVAAPMIIRKLAEHGVPFTEHDGAWVREQVGDYAWMKQAARTMLTWACFTGASLATRARRHIMIDAVTKPLPLRARAAFNVVAAFVASVFCALLMVVAIYYVKENWEQASHLHGWSKGQLHLVFPFAFGAMAARFAIVSLEDLDGTLSGDIEYLRRHEAEEFNLMGEPDAADPVEVPDPVAPDEASPAPPAADAEVVAEIDSEDAVEDVRDAEDKA